MAVVSVGGGIFPVGMVMPYAGVSTPMGWLLAYGQNISRTDYADLFNTIVPSKGTATITNASPGVVTNTAHGFVNGDSVYFTTTGGLPTGLSVNTIYFVVSAAANTFSVAASRGGAAINTSSAGSGTHTLRACPYGLGDGSTTFTLPDMRGRVLAGADAMGGTASTRMNNNYSGGAFGNLGADGGEPGHILTTNEMPAHTHPLPANTDGWFVYDATSPPQVLAAGSNYGMTTSGSTSAGGGAGHNVVQPTILVNYIIKF